MERRISEQRHRDHRMLLGVAIIVAGLLFLANNFGFLDYDIRRYIFRWEVILMVLGVIFIAGNGRRSTGIILLVIGGVFYLRDFLHYDFNFWQIFWPAMLIVAGVLIIFRHRLDGDYRRHGQRILTGDNVIDEIALFGGGDRVVTSQEFQGGKVTTVFGGLNYNMLKAKLAPGENVIDVFCVFGGMKLIVPEGWNVKIRVMSFFGGFSDKHRFRVPETTTENGSTLVIRGTVFFGGGEIKSYFD